MNIWTWAQNIDKLYYVEEKEITVLLSKHLCDSYWCPVYLLDF